MPTAGIERRAGDQKARSAGSRDHDDLLGTGPESIATGGLYHSELTYKAEIGESAIGVMGLLRVASSARKAGGSRVPVFHRLIPWFLRQNPATSSAIGGDLGIGPSLLRAWERSDSPRSTW